MAISAMMTRDEFDRILDSYSGRIITKTIVVKTLSSDYGQETLTESSTTNLKVHFVRTNDKYTYEKAGLFNKADALMLVRGADTINRDDLMTVDGNEYRVSEVQPVFGTFDGDTGAGSQIVYYACGLFLAQSS